MDDCKGLPERVAKLETTVMSHDEMLKAQLEKNETLVKISLLMEQQVDDSKKRDERMEKFSETLVMVNENLTSLNTKQELLTGRVNDIETTLSSQKIDVVQTMKKILIWLVVLGLGGLATYFGLSK